MFNYTLKSLFAESYAPFADRINFTTVAEENCPSISKRKKLEGRRLVQMILKTRKLFLLSRKLIEGALGCNPGLFFTVLIDRMRENGYDGWSKKDIRTNIPHTSEDWEYRYVLDKAISDPNLLTMYHERIPKHYKRSYGSMSDNDLDMMIYGKAFRKASQDL